MFKQRDRSHDLSALAVTTLHDVMLNPGILHGSSDSVLTDAFDCDYRSIADM
jgi:hypothetical protein